MAMDAHALEFLGQLERAESSLLAWGLIDGFFSETELEERADAFLTRLEGEGVKSSHASAWDLVEALLECQLLWRLPDSERYRTRMAEAVRLFARLRQIFPDPRNAAWRTAPSLVADYRFLLRQRIYPIRDVSQSALLETVREKVQLSSLQTGVISALVRTGTANELQLARFQLRSTDRIMRAAGSDRPYGTVICAGTGSGKTLAFYLPAYAVIAERVSSEYWTKCLALYPRNELLKDQLREALANARRIGPALVAHRKRRLVIGALYGDVPNSGRSILASGRSSSWPQTTIRGQAAYICPFVRCPRCGDDMGWLEADIRTNHERLHCAHPQCNEQVLSDEIRLTRERMLAEPPDILFTSTEMLNQRLSSRRFARLFGIGVRSDRRPPLVLIDEVHAYEGVHGAHVALLLRRWRRAAEARPHFVGLSATLADAPRFFGELVGLGPGDVSEVLPEPNELRAEGAEYMLALRGDPSSGTSLLSTTIQALMLLRRMLAAEPGNQVGSRIFAFTDNLDVINRLYHSVLDAEGWDAPGRPSQQRAIGSLANLRGTTLPNARERLELGQNWALAEEIGHILAPGSHVRVARTSSQDAGVDPDADIVVATAALEVGFDDPEVGGVLQHKAPHSPAAFLQRKGRAGRRQSMRPWTVVVLSDYGRDRNAYQGYDQLFSPLLPPRHLPLRNRAVLRMQATFSLCDWLAQRLPPNHSPDPWTDFSQPAGEIESTQIVHEVRVRQGLYVQYLKALLEQSSIREEFAAFLSRALAIDQDEVSAVMWEPPRALITEAVPTLLRRLERGWRRAGTQELEHHTPRAPLPEFLPRTLFSDLQVPDVEIRLPALGGVPARVESMPIAQALREFSPGRVSRRFGVAHGRERHWIAPGNGTEVSIDSFCPSSNRHALGHFALVDDDGNVHRVPVFRPHALQVVLTPLDVQQSSNSFLEWHTEIVPTASGHEVDLPTGSPWAHILNSFSFHTHHLGLPVELRRFSAGATASIGRGRQPQIAYSLRFVSASEHGEEAAGVGFAADVDAIQIKFAFPERLHEICTRDDRLIRALRVARFRDCIRRSVDLDGVANAFQRDWLAQAYLSAITAEALRTGASLEAAEGALHNRTSKTTISEVLETILRWEGEAASEDDDDSPRRLQELLDLVDQAGTTTALHNAARVLWTTMGIDWEMWLRARFKSTLGAALVDAAHDLCPRMNEGALAINIRAHVTHSDFEREPSSGEKDEIWLTETTIGGGGFIEELLARYVEDPRRYFRFLEAALSASDLETTGDELGRVLSIAASSTPDDASFVSAFNSVRTANSHSETLQALSALRIELSRRGIQPTTTLLVSTNTRLLGHGTNSDTDRFLAAIVAEWEASERRLGVDIDARVFALVKSSDSALEQALGVTALGASDRARAAWRFGILYGMLWPRGAQIRTEALRAWNPFEVLPECDRLLVLAALPMSVRQVHLSSDKWFEELSQVLLEDGRAQLVCPVNNGDRLSSALLRIAIQPVDSEAILVHARLAGVYRDGEQIRVEIELPEALQ